MEGPTNKPEQKLDVKAPTKKKKQVTNVEFDPASRKSYLLGLKNKKKRKEKKAKLLAKEELRKARAELRCEKKEKREMIANQMIQKQIQLGISPLPILIRDAGINMEVIEVDPVQTNALSGEESHEEEEEEHE